jgi:hypothetical protein
MQPVIEMDIAYYLLVPESRASLPAVVAFREWIEAEATEFRHSFEKRFRGREIRSTSGRTSVRPATAT